MLKALMVYGLLYLLTVLIVLIGMAVYNRYRGEPGNRYKKSDFHTSLWLAIWWPVVLCWNVLAYILERLLGIEDLWDRFTRRTE